ncbi:hypothetical protein, partial [Phormidium pseudopriestleyi]
RLSDEQLRAVADLIASFKSPDRREPVVNRPDFFGPLKPSERALVERERNRKGKVEIMAGRKPRYSKEEFARMGDHWYETQIRQKVEAGNHGKIVAIDIETGTYEVADEILDASQRLFKRIPEAQPWIVRIGHRAVHSFGARSLRNPG